MYNKQTILVTGGTGYIGSHAVVELIREGFEPIIIDNFDNSEHSVIDRIEKLLGRKVPHYEADCRDLKRVSEIIEKHHISGIIHFAAHKAVGESVANPVKYYDNNICGFTTILKAANKHNCNRIVFSSSCTVYGSPETLPVDESAPVKKADSPYGNTKIICEQILEDYTKSNSNSQAISLRYFNPIGADESSLIGELPIGTPNNLVPFMTQVAAGWREKLTVFGADYDTADGSCIRDYIHVTDLARAHVKALDFLANNSVENGHDVFNIGTGKGFSVLKLIQLFEQATGVKLNYEIGQRRTGDVKAVYADATKASEILNWEAEIAIETALKDAWNWQKTLYES